MEDNEFKISRTSKLPPIGRTVSETVRSPFVGDEGRLDDYYQDSNFGDTGMSKFRETGMSRPDTTYGPKEEDLIMKADAKAEIHFIGQLLGGEEFACHDGLFCEMLLSHGDTWKMLNPPKIFQTQVCYADSDAMFVWAHPIDLFFSVGDLQGWPRAVFRIWRLDKSNKIDTYSYGIAQLPRTAGHHRIECDTWTPVGTWRSGALSFFLRTNPRLHNMDVMSDFMENRDYLNSNSSGKVVLELDVIMKNFSRLGLSGQLKSEISKE